MFTKYVFIKYFFLKKNLHTSIKPTLPSIYALTTGLNSRCGVAVVRISGAKCLDIIKGLTLKTGENLEPRKMYLRDFYDPISKEKIDKGLLVWFKGS
jgi:tRNA U34 5-carboxymethylaminomethyl modifying GTPase MnmE/TrmE